MSLVSVVLSTGRFLTRGSLLEVLRVRDRRTAGINLEDAPIESTLHRVLPSFLFSRRTEMGRSEDRKFVFVRGRSLFSPS